MTFTSRASGRGLSLHHCIETRPNPTPIFLLIGVKKSDILLWFNWAQDLRNRQGHTEAVIRMMSNIGHCLGSSHSLGLKTSGTDRVIYRGGDYDDVKHWTLPRVLTFTGAQDLRNRQGHTEAVIMIMSNIGHCLGSSHSLGLKTSGTDRVIPRR